MNWDKFDGVVDMFLLGSSIGPMIKKLLPLLKSFVKFEMPSDAHFKDAAAAAAEFDKRFETTFDDENFFERVRSALRLDNETYDQNLSVLISALNPAEKKALRKLIFAGMETAGIDGGAFILANLAARGPELADMQTRFKEMDLTLEKAKDPKKAFVLFSELWREKIEPYVSAKWHETALSFNQSLAEIETQMRKPVPLQTLLFLDGFRLPSMPATTKGKWVAGLAALAALVYLIYLFTPQR